MEWPGGFMWGTGASSTQTEGAAPASDWIDWERTGHAPASGDGNGFATRYEEDFALLAELGLTHHRLSIEWARVVPEEGSVDHDAVDHYRRVLTAARAAGLSPWVCLHHFTLPRWFADQGGFLADDALGKWEEHVRFIRDTFGDLVFGWQPVNETNYYAGAAYRARGWPPGHDDRDEWLLATERIHLASATAARLLSTPTTPSSSIFGLSVTVPLDDSDATNRVVDRHREFNWDIGLGLFRDGVLAVPGRSPIEAPELARSFDLIGFSFYANAGVRDGALVSFPVDAPVSPLGYGIDPSGLGLVIERLHAEVPGVPLLVAEFGVGTDDDHFRARYLRDGLEVVHEALERGRDIRGFFHWTAVDNYEWLHGFDVSFGLIDRDRRIRESAQVLSREARRSDR